MKFNFLLPLVFIFFSKNSSANSITVPYGGKIKIQVCAAQPFYINDKLIANGCYKLTFCQVNRNYTVFSIDLKENDSLNVVITCYRGNLYNRMFGIVAENYSIYKKSIDHYFSYNNHVLHSSKWRMHDEGSSPTKTKQVFYVQTALTLNDELNNTFRTLNGFFMHNYLDCTIIPKNVISTPQCKNLTFSLATLRQNNAGEHTEHDEYDNTCTISVKEVYLYYFILLAHEFGHHFINSDQHFNQGPFPTRFSFLPRNYNVMHGEICTTMIQNIGNASFDLNRIVDMNNSIAQCFDAQAQAQ